MTEPIDVAFTFPSKKLAEGFLNWLSGQGEQMYWEDMEMTGEQMVTFNYNCIFLFVETELMESEE